MQFLQAFISNLYRGGEYTQAEDFQAWALKELKALIPFDGALWGMGNDANAKFHNVVVVGLPSSYAHAIESTTDINPIYPALSNNIGRATTMDEVFPDEDFYTSHLYHGTFSPFGVNRILAIGAADARSGLYTLMSLYRFNRDQPFSLEERQIYQTVSFHLIQAYAHVFFMRLIRPVPKKQYKVSAVVDREGVLHQAEPAFLDILEKHYPDWKGRRLPFDIEFPGQPQQLRIDDLHVTVKPVADLFLLRLRDYSPLDDLTPREKEVVICVCRGLSHKATGKELGLSPTTVASHLYRAFNKLNIKTRNELAQMIYQYL